MKVYNYVVLTTGIMIVLFLSGLGVPSIEQTLQDFGITKDNATLSWSSVFNYLFSTTGILAALAIGVGAIIAGLLTQSKTENLIILPFITGHLVIFGSVFVSILNYSLAGGEIPKFIGYIVLMILGPVAVGYFLALVEFFRGTD